LESVREGNQISGKKPFNQSQVLTRYSAILMPKKIRRAWV